MSYIPVIGLEIHAELSTHSKVFCTCGAQFGGQENTRCCPRCAGLPGTLPVVNKGVVEYAVRAGLALGCRINLLSSFDRKNYFYPDLPKAYQITQMERPICTDGLVEVEGGPVRINRIHIEEDAGKLIHDDMEGVSLADYNRCGVPLIEIVTEPDIKTAEQAKNLVEEIAWRLKYAGVCDAKMEEGSLRCDVNISIMPQGAKEYGTRAEIKNLNSLKSIGRAINYEIKRQSALLDAGKPVIQQTRRYNDNHDRTTALRSKEEAHDYRYFPEPDILPVQLSEEEVRRIADGMPEMPASRIQRYETRYGLSHADALLLTSERPLADFYEAAVACHPNYQSVAAFMVGELLRRLNDRGLAPEEIPFTPVQFAQLVKLSDGGQVARNDAKALLNLLFDAPGDPQELAESRGYLINTDPQALAAAVDGVLKENPKAVAEYRQGSAKVFGFLMGQAVKKIGRGADPKAVKTLLEQKLKEVDA